MKNGPGRQINCSLCSKLIKEGAAFYIFEARFISGAGEVIADYPDPDKEITSALEALEKYSEQEVMDDVYTETTHILCPGCKRGLSAELQSRLAPQTKPTPKKRTSKKAKILPFQKNK